MAKTQQTRLVEVLVRHMKATIVPGRSKKYVTLMVPGTDTRYFVGKAGSVRFGRVFTESYPMLPETKAKWLRISVRDDAEAL